MQLKTSRTIGFFAGLTGACALLGGAAQISSNLDSSRRESYRSQALTTIADHKLGDTCRRSYGGQFQKGHIIPEQGGLTPTACYQNELGETAFAAYEGGALVVKEVYSQTQVNARISERKKEKKND